MIWLRWFVPIGSFAAAYYFLNLSYSAYVKWQEYVALGDFSGAEAYEVEFWAEITCGVGLILLGAFLAGRWSAKR